MARVDSSNFDRQSWGPERNRRGYPVGTQMGSEVRGARIATLCRLNHVSALTRDYLPLNSGFDKPLPSNFLGKRQRVFIAETAVPSGSPDFPCHTAALYCLDPSKSSFVIRAAEMSFPEVDNEQGARTKLAIQQFYDDVDLANEQQVLIAHRGQDADLWTVRLIIDSVIDAEEAERIVREE